MSILNSPRFVRRGGFLGWSLSLILAAWLGSDLLWRFFSPRPISLPVTHSTDPKGVAESVANRHMMGAQSQNISHDESSGALIRHALQGVMTSSGTNPGWAIIASNGGSPQGFVQGDEVSPGVILTHVAPDHVELTQGGTRQKLKLDAKEASAPLAVYPNPSDVNRSTSALMTTIAATPVPPAFTQ